jgi:bacteriocin-like protein
MKDEKKELDEKELDEVSGGSAPRSDAQVAEDREALLALSMQNAKK